MNNQIFLDNLITFFKDKGYSLISTNSYFYNHSLLLLPQNEYSVKSPSFIKYLGTSSIIKNKNFNYHSINPILPPQVYQDPFSFISCDESDKELINQYFFDTYFAQSNIKNKKFLIKNIHLLNPIIKRNNIISILYKHLSFDDFQTAVLNLSISFLPTKKLPLQEIDQILNRHITLDEKYHFYTSLFNERKNHLSDPKTGPIIRDFLIDTFKDHPKKLETFSSVNPYLAKHLEVNYNKIFINEIYSANVLILNLKKTTQLMCVDNYSSNNLRNDLFAFTSFLSTKYKNLSFKHDFDSLSSQLSIQSIDKKEEYSKDDLTNDIQLFLNARTFITDKKFIVTKEWLESIYLSQKIPYQNKKSGTTLKI